MSRPEKVFKSTTDQLQLLQRRGLVIDDPMFAEEALIRTSYYEIINGYKDLFIDANAEEESFHTGTTFSEIYYLYEMDNTLRFALLSATLSGRTFCTLSSPTCSPKSTGTPSTTINLTVSSDRGRKFHMAGSKGNTSASCCCKSFPRSTILHINR